MCQCRAPSSTFQTTGAETQAAGGAHPVTDVTKVVA